MRAVFLLACLVGASASRPNCAAESLDVSSLASYCPFTKGAACQSTVLNNVCLVQETIVLFDPDGADGHPDGTLSEPEFDVTDVPYWYRHASPEHIERMMHDTEHPHKHPSTVLGHQINYAPLPVRFAAVRELDASPEFDNCTLPLIIWSPWIMNYAETTIRVPTLLVRLKDVLSGASVAMATPMKLPLDPFNVVQLAPFSARPPTSFAELSALTGNNFTEHEACFKRVVLLKANSGAYPELPAAADAIAAYYEPFSPPPWKSSGEATTRIVFEKRPNKAMRQFIDLEVTLSSCLENTALECLPWTFGADIRADIALMREADILVAYHGAGEINSLYMKPHSAILEIRGRGFGTTHGWWPAFWWPMISMQTQQRIFFWGLNIEDPALNKNSPQEEEGLEKNAAFNARDRFVTLHWGDFLYLMLQKVIAMKRNVEAYRALYGTNGRGVVYTYDGNGLAQDPPVFCSECPLERSLDCKKC